MSRLHALQPALVLAALLACGCSRVGPDEKPSKTPAATIAKPADDSAATITLTPEAEARLGLTLVAAEVRAVERTRTYGAVAVTPAGGEVAMHAPLAGTLRVAADSPPVGARVRRGQAIFSLEPLIAPPDQVQLAKLRNDLAVARADAQGALSQARARSDAAAVALQRAEKLLSSDAGSARARDEALAETAAARAQLDAAGTLHETLARIEIDAETTALPILAPLDGVLTGMNAADGQSVASGAALFSVARHDPMWLRVPIYAGDLDHIARERDASISLAGANAPTRRAAKPVAAPPTADATAATVDLWYALDNSDAALRPGQRVDATLSLRASADSLVVPWSSVIFDALGGAWVYASAGPHEYRRRRVEVAHVAGSDAVLAHGPEPGTRVVAIGAAELYGTEFGAGK